MNMLKGASANRMTKIKIFEDGKSIKIIPNASINFGQNFEQLKKMLELAIRLSPSDPYYKVERVFFSPANASDIEFDQSELEQFQASLFKPENLTNSSKLTLCVHVAGKGPQRAGSLRDVDNQENSAQPNTQVTQVSVNKYDSIINSSGSSSRSRTTTPNRARAVSRGRCAAAPVAGGSLMSPTPAGGRLLPRGMSPCRPTQHDRSAIIAAAAAASIAESSAQVEGTVVTVVDERSSDEVPGVVKAKAPPVTTPIRNKDKVKEEKEAIKASRRMSQMQEHAAIESSIKQTWADASSTHNSPMPPADNTLLAPFVYYSPQPEEEEGDEEGGEEGVDDDDYRSCAGDLGMEIMNEESNADDESVHEATTADNNDTSVNTSVNTSMNAVTTTPLSPLRISKKAPTPKQQANSARKASMSSAQKMAAARAKVILGANLTLNEVGKPVYPDGRTQRELSVSYEQGLRNYGPSTSGSATKGKKPSASNNNNELSPLGFKTKSTSASAHAMDGRPSIGTITSQWEFMRTNFVNNSDEELEWLMVSKRPGAYKYANRKNEQAEDKYFKSLYDIDMIESRIQVFGSGIGKIPAILGELAGVYNTLMATPNNEEAHEKAVTLLAKLNDVVKTHPADLFTVFTPKLEQSMNELFVQTEVKKIVRKARDVHTTLTTEIPLLHSKLQVARKDGDDALKNMEKWSKRAMEAEEYPTAMLALEQEFMHREYDANMLAFNIMRGYYPVNFTDMSVNEIVQQYRDHNGLISLELAQELKTNRCLQWLETHMDDITYDSFLTGEKKAFFENIENLDIIELRALAIVIPKKFELDNDNKKLEWRTRFFNRLKQLVAQEHKEQVKGAWDGKKNCRMMVDLPPLKPEQARRAIYYFRTKEVHDQKLKQLDDKLALLVKKRGMLEVAEKEAKEAKEEYDIVLKDMRDIELLELYGQDQWLVVKDMAKNLWTQAETKRKNLTVDVTRLEKTINDSPMTRDQFVERAEELQAFIQSKFNEDWTVPKQHSFLIEGVFPSDKPIEKRIKAAAKFQSAEEEAAKRKAELELLSSSSRPALASLDDPMMISDEIAAIMPDEDGAGSGSVRRATMRLGSFSCTNNTNNAAGSLSTATAATPIGGSSSSFEDRMDRYSICSSSSSSALTPKPTPRKNSILVNANPEMLNTLNKMFTSPSAMPNNGNTGGGGMITRSRTPNRRASIAIGAAPSTTVAVDGPKEVKQSKSKLLKKLLQPPPPPAVAAPEAAGSNGEGIAMMKRASMGAMPFGGAGGGGLSFLDQLKARSQAKVGGGGSATGSDATENALPVKPAAAPLSFLDQFKARANKANGEGDTSESSSSEPASASSNVQIFSKTISFPIQHAASDNSDNGEATAAVVVSEPRKNPFAVMLAGNGAGTGKGGGVSFLEQIKARRIKEE